MTIHNASDVARSAVATLANSHRRREREPLLFSVIIPALNEEKVIGLCLDALVRQNISAADFEVILVDNGSTDRTIEIASEFQASLRLTILGKPKCNISVARNAAAASAKGTFLAFLDADCLPSPEWLERALQLLRRGDGGIIGSFYTVPEDSKWVAKAWYGDLPNMRRGPATYVPAGTLFVTHGVFSKLGGFDPDLQTSEDFELCQRTRAAGYQVLCCPELSTLHLGTPQTVKAFYRKQRWHGNGIRTVLVRNALERGFTKTILQTLFMCVAMFSGILALPVAIRMGDPLIAAASPAGLLLGSLALAIHAAHQRRRLGLIFPLTLLYGVYGVARGLSLIGIGGLRDQRVILAQSPATETK